MFLCFGHDCVCFVCVVLCVCVVCCVYCVWWVCSRFLVGVFKIFGGCLQDFWWVSSRFLVGVFKIIGPLRWTLPPPPDCPKFRSFPPQFSFFLLSLGGLLVEFWWCLKHREAQMCAFAVLWLKPRPFLSSCFSVSFL